MNPFHNFDKILRSRWKLKLFFLKVLPMGFLAGLRVEEVSEHRVVTSVPFKYLNKNPFASMYFAVQSMAAELSTAIIALRAISRSPVPVSMLVLNMQAEFTKKAKTRIFFTCQDINAIEQTIEESIKTGQGRTITITSTGTDEQGQVVSVFHFTWTFKPKIKQQNNENSKDI